MLQGMYTAAAGMLAHDAMAEVISNNLSNAATPGFRQDFATFHMAAERATGDDRTSLSPMLTFRAYTNFDLGRIQATEKKLDLALEDKGENFFVVDSPRGERYTRAGNFQMDSGGRLVTSDQLPVLGMNGPVRIDGGDVNITREGEVLVDGELVDRLQIVHFDRINGRIPVQKEGYSLFKPISEQSAPRQTTHPNVRQGFLESSNVQLMHQMAQLIHIVRGFEAYQRAILVSDASLNMLIQRVGGGS